MDLAQSKKIEEKLKKLIELENQSNKEVRTITSRPAGIRVIRRRKGSPDKHIF
ncbi:MAG: hypothetical protein JRJ65_12840 [Deltaproteobacteria bacterium]|nr:hypothetical protein [Deltaproteobacteria bacterium]